MSSELDTRGSEFTYSVLGSMTVPEQVPEQVLVGDGGEQAPRWRPGERLHHLFEDRCDRIRQDGRLAVDSGEAVLSYDQLDARANQLARYLRDRGVGPGDRIGLLFDDAVYSYAAMLGVLKINAAYVPLDAGFPADRLSYIVGDAEVSMVLSLAHLSSCLESVLAEMVCLDEDAGSIAAQDDRRLSSEEAGDPVDELCYVIYTSGSTGRPKGVPIEHASICNFVRVAAEVYGIGPTDRMYQGMTIAFDFSVEEIWVPLIAGATLVPKPAGVSLLGPELREFLQDKAVTALCAVPTLLATLDEDIPGLRFVLVSGEACPHDLIVRWYRPDRRFLNVYGPTEATVTATWAVVHPARPVTIGVPLPTYSVVILDPDSQRALRPGEVGEIGLAGIGLAGGYLNRPEQTERAFIPDFLGIGNNPSGRIYRTGDLGRVNEDGEIEYHGRVDSQVKIRGYRVELTEIESVLLQVPDIAQAVVDTHQPQPDTVELVAYYTRRDGTTGVDTDEVYKQLQEHLPRYMLPAYLEELADIPRLPSDKADRKNLPRPRGPRCQPTTGHYAAPQTWAETLLADALAQSLGLDQVSVEGNFFDDLGANSLLMAQFCTQVRNNTDLPSPSMKDIYLHPTIRALATALPAPTPAVPEQQAPGVGGVGEVPASEVPRPAGTPRYLLCGALQLLLFVCWACLGAVVWGIGFGWVEAGDGMVEIWLRSVGFTVTSFLLGCTLPILAKWVLIGRWTPQQIPVWSLRYVRFWTVKTLIRTNPLVLFVGSPLYVLYLKALGARIGRDAAIFSRTVPVCTDLLTIGENTVIRKDTLFPCYRAQHGLIQTGPVTLGKNVVVGEETVLDIHTTLGDQAQLGHTSSLHPFQTVPAGQRWHGCPAQPTNTDYRTVPDSTRCSTTRKVLYSLVQLLNRLVLVGPLAIVLLATLYTQAPLFVNLFAAGQSLLTWTFYRNALGTSLLVFAASVLIGLAFVVTLPRLLNITIQPDRVYPLYGVHYWIQQMITRVSSVMFFMRLFGDSSAIVHYLRALGYNLVRVLQTGSNFGNDTRQDNPRHCSVGTGTMLSDRVSIQNVEFSSTSFRMSRVSLGARSFFGNNIAYPAQGKTGDNCLLATKVMIPIDGQLRENVGLLGSPPFEIPRSAQSSSLDQETNEEKRRHRLPAKNRYNAATIGWYLLGRWMLFFVIILLALAAIDLSYLSGTAALASFTILTFVFIALHAVLIERLITGFRSLRPQFCSIYDPYYWWHERLWKLEASPRVLFSLSGTPFKNLIWRLLDVRIGRRVFDDGCYISEKTLVALGDDCTLNEKSVIQCHSQEEGTFKSDRTTLGAGATVGINAFIHYGVTIGDGAALDANSFLMKGEEITPHTTWGGNPAMQMHCSQAQPSCQGPARSNREKVEV